MSSFPQNIVCHPLFGPTNACGNQDVSLTAKTRLFHLDSQRVLHGFGKVEVEIVFPAPTVSSNSLRLESSRHGTSSEINQELIVLPGNHTFNRLFSHAPLCGITPINQPFLGDMNHI